MNAVVKEPEVLPPAVSTVAEYNATAAGLAELTSRIASATYDCTTAAGDKLAREDRRLCVSIRTAIDAKRTDLNAPLLKAQRENNSEATRIIGIVSALEAKPDAAIKAQEKIEDDARKERERIKAEAQAKVDKEIQRIANLPVAYVSANQAILRGVIMTLSAERFDAWEGVNLLRAQEAQGIALAALKELLDARIAADEQAVENERVRAENERIAAEAKEQLRIDTERADAERAEKDRLAQVERDRKQAESDAAQKVIDDERKARLQREDDEREEQARIDKIKSDSIAAERAELDRIQEQARARAEQEAIEQVEREEVEQAAREQAAIEKATLIEAAFDARELLTTAGYGNHIVTRKLAAALKRAEPPAIIDDEAPKPKAGRKTKAVRS